MRSEICVTSWAELTEVLYAESWHEQIRAASSMAGSTSPCWRSL
jgi:hypothetical protein